MGDRALIIVTDRRRAEVSPVIYTHWGGSTVPAVLDDAWELMGDRTGNVGYAAARIVGILHERTPGNLSLGVWNTPQTIQSAIRSGDADDLADALEDYSHGNAGVVLYDCSTGEWTAYGGYLDSGDASERRVDR